MPMVYTKLIPVVCFGILEFKMESPTDLRLKAYRLIAYSAVGFSVTAAVALCLTLPLIFTYVENTKAQLHRESLYCKV